jgi:OOP family OmpA-OmpF porin
MTEKNSGGDSMRKMLFVAALGASTLVMGCATKNYVRQTEQPIQAKVDQVSDQSNKQGTEIEQSQKDISKNTTDISATKEIATGADSRAGDAMNKATQVDKKADQNTADISSLRNTIANIDDYKVVNTATVLFPFNSAKLSKDDMAQLDMLMGNTSSLKRYFIAIEGYTDKTGSADYNLTLSTRRADAVTHYLAGEKDVDFNRIHTIGFGEMKLADPGTKSADRAKNRRVEVKIYSADAAMAASAR